MGSAGATSINVWTNFSGDGDWNNPLNWQFGLPTAGQTIQIGVSKPGPALNVPDGVTVFVYDNVANYGEIVIDSTGDATAFLIEGNAAFSGGGQITLSDSAANVVDSNTGGSILDNVDNTLSGAGNIYSNGGRLSIVNESLGTIDASGTKNSLQIENISVTNDGLLEATGAGGLVFYQATLDQSGGGALEANGGDIYIGDAVDLIGGTLSTPNGLIQVDGPNSAFDGSKLLPVTITSGTTVEIDDDANLTITGSIVNDGELLLGSTADNTDLIINGAASLSGDGVISLSDSNANRIYSDTGSTVLSNIDDTIEGAGQIYSNGGRLAIVNEAGGVIDADATDALDINNIDITNDGLVEATESGELILAAMSLDQSGGGSLEGASGHVNISNNVDIIGGTLSAPGGGIGSTSVNSVLDDSQALPITIAKNTAVQIDDNDNLAIAGSIVVLGAISLVSNGDNTDLLVKGATSLTGGGVVDLDDSPNNRIYSNEGGAVLTNVDDLIEGSGQVFSNGGRLSIVNKARGVIDANGLNNSLDINNIVVTNDGVVYASAGAGLSLQAMTLDQSAGGSLQANGGNVNIGDNVDIIGGTLSATGGGLIVSTSAGSVLDGSQTLPIAIEGGTVVEIENGHNLSVLGTIDNNGEILVNSTTGVSDLIVAGNTIFEGSGDIVLSDMVGATSRNYSDTGGTTLDNQQTIEGSGEIFSNAGRMTLINDANGVIDATGAYTLVVHDISVDNENVLESTQATGPLSGLAFTNATIDNTNGGANNNGEILADGVGSDVALDNATIIGGTLSATNGGLIQVVGGGGHLVGTQAGDPVTLAAGSVLQIDDSEDLTLDSGATPGSIVNKGEIALASSGDTVRLLIGTTGRVELSGGGTLSLSDSAQNQIYSNYGSSILDNIDNTIEGSGGIYSNGGRLELVVNEAKGVIDATGALNQLQLFNLDITNGGLIEATGAAGLNIDSGTQINDAVGGVIDAAGGNVYINGATIVGGELEGSGGGAIDIVGGVVAFDGSGAGEPITIASGTVVQISDGQSLTLTNASGADESIINKGEIALDSSGDTTLLLVGATGTVTLSGGGTVSLSDSSHNQIYSNYGGSILDNIDNTIEGSGGIYSNGDRLVSVVNESKGVIDASGGVNQLELNNLNVTNNGLVEATGAAGLYIDNSSTIDGAGGGLIEAAGGNVYISNSTIVGGALESSGGGLFTDNGGTVYFDGSGNNAPVTVAAGTTFQVEDGDTLSLLNTSGPNDSIVNKGEIELESTGDATQILLGATGTASLSGGGIVALSDNPYNRIYNNYGGSVLDNADNTIEGAGRIFGNGSRFSLDNEANGVIAATYADSALTIDDNLFDNQGTARAANGATLALTDGLVNLTADPNFNNGSELVGGAYDVVDPLAGGASAITIMGDGATQITTLNATVDLAGATSTLTSNGVALTSSLSVIGTEGSLNLYYGYNSQSQQVFDDTAISLIIDGSLELTGAQLQAQTIYIYGGAVYGAGEYDGSTAENAEISGSITNHGTIYDTGGLFGTSESRFIINGDVSGSGAIWISFETVLEMTGASSTGQTINFENNESSALQQLQIDTTSIGAAGAFASVIQDFRAGDAIDLANLSGETGYSYHDDILTVNFAGGQSASLSIVGFTSSTVFNFSNYGANGTQITLGVTESLVADTSNGRLITSDDELTGTAAPEAHIVFSEGGAILGDTIASGYGGWNFTPSGLADGAHTILAQEENNSGLITSSASLSFNLEQDSGLVAALSVVIEGGSSTPIGAAGAGSVAVSVAGLKSDDQGALTFSDGVSADNQTLSIINGVLSQSDVNLSLMKDGAVTSLLSVADAANNVFTKAGNIVTLDQGLGEQTQLKLTVDGGSSAPIGDAGASGVGFVVSGLEPVDTGSVTFTDVDGQSVLVAIVAGQSNYNVNLSALANGPIASALSVNSGGGAAFAPVSGNVIALDQAVGEQAALQLTVDGGSGAPIGAGEASSVAFTVAGVQPGDHGLVTFTDSSGDNVKVAVTGGQTRYVANLSSLGDGTVSAQLTLAPDAGGNSFTPIAGNDVSLTQDLGEQAALALTVDGGGSPSPVGAAAASNVGFTVSGLQPGDSGLVTFTDATGGKVTVAVSGDQSSYSVDLAGLADGAIASSLSVATDAAGNSFTPVRGNSVTLAQDLAEQAALTLSVDGGASLAQITRSASSSVPFSIAGLASTDSGLVTFTDVDGASAQVAVQGGQTQYTANLSSLALGAVTTTLSVGQYAFITNFDKNANIQASLIPEFPTGIFEANNAWGTPFDITSNNSGDNFAEIGGSLAIDVGLQDVTNVYTLMNAQAPPAGDSLATVEFIGSGGAEETFTLVDGVQVRNWNDSGYANATSGATTQNAFSINGVAGGSLVGGTTGNFVIDEQDFALDDAFASQTLQQIVITNLGSGGTPILLGVTAQTATDAAGNSFLPVAGNSVDLVPTPAQPAPPPPLVTGTAWGDVHMVTFDGLAYNFQAVGEFVLAKSTHADDSYQVQIRTAPFSSGATVSVITEIAAEVGDDRVTFGLNRDDVVWIDGVGQTLAVGGSVTIGKGAGTLTEVSSTSYQLAWASGEILDVTDSGSYFSLTTTLAPGAGAGSVEGLLGSDSGQANDFQTAAGTVIPQPLSSDDLYGEFADAWRIPVGAQGLFDYGLGETTNDFSDSHFPSDTISLADLPQNLVEQAQQEVAAAGITDPGLSLDAELDLIVTGNLGVISSSQNVQQSGVTTTQANITGALSPPPLAGISAVAARQVEDGSGVTAVSFDVYLTKAASTDTPLTYAVVAPYSSNLGFSSASLAAFGGVLPTGEVTIAAGQTSAQLTIDVPNTVLSALPSGALDVLIGAPQDVPVFAPTAQTLLINDQPEPGNAADPSISEVSTNGTLTRVGNAYTLNLGDVVAGEAAQVQLAIANIASAPADSLGGVISDRGTGGFSVTGDGTIASALTPGQNYQGLYVDFGAGALGAQDDLLTFTPTDENETGYSANLTPLTIDLTDNVLAPAIALINPGGAQPASINIGAVRIGAAPSGSATATLTLENAAGAGAADLDAFVGGASSGVTASGAVVQLAPGATSTNLKVGLNTSTGGQKFGAVSLNFNSDAGNGNVAPLQSQTVTVTGTVYQEAQVSIAPIDEIIHVGDSTLQDLKVADFDAANGYSEGALVSEIGLTGDDGLNGVAGATGIILAGQSSYALQFQLASIAQAGVYTGTLTVDVKTEGADVANGLGGVVSDGFGETDLGDSSGAVTVTVDNSASPVFEKTAGAGSLTQTGDDSYSLDLGALTQGSGAVLAGFGVRDATPGGPTDLLSGNFSISGNSAGAFSQGAFAEFNNLAGNQEDSAPQIELSTAQSGLYSETITLTSTGSNASGYSAALATKTLTIVGDVLPVTITAPTQIVEQGQGNGAVTLDLDVVNTESSGGEPIQATITSFTPSVQSASGVTAQIAAGGDDEASLGVTFSTLTSGVISGKVSVDLKQGSTDLGTVAVPVSLTVDSPAVAEVTQIGGAGVLTQTAPGVYTLNLGSTYQGDAGLIGDLGILNASSSPSDLLGGSFVGPTGDPEYANGGFGDFSGFGARQTAGTDVVELTTYKVGTFAETFSVDPTSTDAANDVSSLTPDTVTVVGTILPAPPPPPPPLATGVAWGDVHITTFDGLLYNFQAEGEFTLAKSTLADDSYNVQIRLEPYSPGASVSVITQTAVGVGDEKVTFGLDRGDEVVWIDGSPSSLSANNDTITLDHGAGVVSELSTNAFQVTWASGEVLNVSDEGAYFDVTTTLSAKDGPGSVEGLLGADSGQADDFQTATGTLLPQPLAISDLYGQFAQAWRVTPETTLFDYPSDEGTLNFTDKNFPADYGSLGAVPANILAQAQALVKEAGITDAGLQEAAELDFIVTGNPNAVTFSQNAQQQGVTTTSASVDAPPPSTELGVSAATPDVTEAANGVTEVTFSVYLTQAAATATDVDWEVAAPDDSFLDASAFGGAVPTGTAEIARGATTGTFTIDIPGGALGTASVKNLEVQVTGDSENDTIFAPTAQTAILNSAPVAGPTALPVIAELSGGGALSQNGDDYTLDLGTLTQGAAQTIQLAVLNSSASGADNLTGEITDNGASGCVVTGDGGLPLIAAGQSYQGLRIALGTAATGAQSETITFKPTDFNATGYAKSLATETVTINYQVAPTVAVTISDDNLTLSADTATVDFTFSSAPVDFNLTDVTAIGGTLSGLTGAGKSFAATFTAASGIAIADASISVTASSWHDGSSVAGGSASTSAFSVDTLAPTVAVSIDHTDLTLAQDQGTVTFNFSNAPNDFSLSDVTATGGTLNDLYGGGTIYTAIFTAAAGTSTDNAVISVTDDSYHADGVAGAGGSTAPFTVETLTPSVTSLVATPADAVLALGAKITLTVEFDEAVSVVGGIPTLSLNDGGEAVYDAAATATLGDPNAIEFAYTVGAGQNISSLAVTGLALHGASIEDANGNRANLNNVTSGLGGGISVSTALPLSLTASQALAIEAGTVALEPANTPFIVVDTAANIAANFDALNADQQVTSITLTGGGAPSLNLATTEPSSDASALEEITNDLFKVITPESTIHYAGHNGSAGPDIAVYAGGEDFVEWAASRLDVIGANNTITAGDNSSLGVNGDDDSVTAGADDGIWLNGGIDDTLYASSDIFHVAAGVVATILGGSNRFNAELGGDTMTLGGNGASGADNYVSATNDTIALQSNARADVIGANDTIHVDSSATLGVNGDDDNVTAAANDGLWLNGGTGDIVNATGDSVSVAAGVGATILGSSDWVVAKAGSDTLTLGGNGAAGPDITLVASDDTLSLQARSRMDVIGANNQVNVGAQSTLGLNGNDNTITVAAGDTLWLNGGSGDAIDIGAIGGSVIMQVFHPAAGNWIDLTGGAGGYASVGEILSALVSDGRGGTSLSLGDGHSVDFLGVTPNSLNGSNFRIG